MDWFVKILQTPESIAHIVILYALVISLGVKLGRWKIGGRNGIAFGVTWVLFVGIIVGHICTNVLYADPAAAVAYQKPIIDVVKELGLILFVYCIGLQVGPSFFETFKSGGLGMNLLTASLVMLNVVVMLGLYYLGDFAGIFSHPGDANNLPMMVGVMYGAVTNTPGLGAANGVLPDLIQSGTIPTIANGYACAYPLGVVGIILATLAIRLLTGISYEKEQVLKDISFIAKQGELTALVGASGAGKSTIGALIPRFYEPTDGVIKLGGVNIQEMPSKSLMENISFVFQDNDLLSGTIFQNIAMAKKGCSKEEVIEAAKKARCHDFIMKLEKGYETILGKGNTLSGGEKQRIAVARAMLKDAPVLILDEATSYADSKNECLMQEALAELVKDKTVIMIAHRLGTIKNAQQILVLSEGQIVERGTHESLMKEEGVYRKMFSIFDEVRSWKMKREGGLYHA